VSLTKLALAGAIAAALVPQRVLRATPTVCLFRRLTGRPCPSCGLTRSWNAATRLQVRESFELHPFGPQAVPAIVWLIYRHGENRGQPAAGWSVVLSLLAGAWLAAWLRRLARVDQPTG
jgi:hypothetical protein